MLRCFHIVCSSSNGNVGHPSITCAWGSHRKQAMNTNTGAAFTVVLGALWSLSSACVSCTMPPCRSRSREQEPNRRRWYTTMGHSCFSCSQNVRLCFRITDRCFLSWLLWEYWKCESLWVMGRVAETWSDSSWVAGSISSLTTTFKSQNVSLRELTGTQVVRKEVKATSSTAVPLLPVAQVLLSTILFSHLCSWVVREQ